ncbi:YihY/virulence factor BrkB family protein [Bacteroides propionicifaciens]|uniref:YihY/virulence factor BrkB family protein n=1 Tax=Bacteroides propionicifaciens TaxID=392838 RepID=UPI000377629F|nr:YihY/virulence factor BrkB family protein [Bacteroides propionicifaciens]
MHKRISKFIQFITVDIWRITENEVTKTTFSLYNVIKTIYITVLQFIDDRIGSKASALTYSTILAIVPILAILFAIAKGFGFDSILENQLMHSFHGQPETATAILDFVNSYLKQTKGGVFIGVGLAMLLWTVVSLLNNIEQTFNQIWQVKKARTMYRKVTDYFSMFLLLPILIISSAGASIFITTTLAGVSDYVLLGAVSKFFIQLIPFAITWLMFTGLYIFMPNTKVKLRHALTAGVLAGTIYQIFQIVYISGQVWVSKYNAIYGSFAAVPLFLLWLQTSWTICLFGAQLTYTSQNIRLYSFNKDTRNVSRRYRDFIAISIMSLLCKRFENNEEALTIDQISAQYKIPVRLVNRTIITLLEVELITEVIVSTEAELIGFQPAMDINKLSIAVLLDRIDEFGSEDFKVDNESVFKDQWDALIETRRKSYAFSSELLIKDLNIRDNTND